MSMRLVIEMDDTNYAQYGSIHKRGCSHVKDPMPIVQNTPNLAALTEVFNWETGWDYEPIEVQPVVVG